MFLAKTPSVCAEYSTIKLVVDAALIIHLNRENLQDTKETLLGACGTVQYLDECLALIGEQEWPNWVYKCACVYIIFEGCS